LSHSSLFDCLMSFLELELEVADLRECVDVVVAFVRAQDINRGECPLGVANRVQLAVRHGATGALAFVQFRSSYELDTDDLPEDAAISVLEDFEDGSDIVAEAVVNTFSLTNVVNGSP
jgi:hypothetical protein